MKGDTTVGPQTPGPIDSALNAVDRPTDYAGLSTMVPANMFGAGKKDKLTPLEKLEVLKGQVNVVVGADLSASYGDTDAQQARAQHALDPLSSEQRTASVVPMVATSTPNLETRDVFRQADAIAQSETDAQQRQENLKGRANPLAQVGQTIENHTLIPLLLRKITAPEFPADPTFDYYKAKENVETPDMSPEQAELLSNSHSQAELNYRYNIVQRENLDNQLMGAHGTTMALLTGLTGAASDPTMLLGPMGITKVAQLARIGSGAYRASRAAAVAEMSAKIEQAAALNGAKGAAVDIAQGRLLDQATEVGDTVNHLSRLQRRAQMIEGSAAGVLGTAALGAAGEHVSPSDIITSAAFGALVGRSGDAVDDVLTTLQAQAADINHALYMKAQDRAGSFPTSQDVARNANQTVQDAVANTYQRGLAPVADSDRLFPLMDHGDSNSPLPLPEDTLMPASVRADVSRRFSLEGMAGEVDPAMRTQVEEVIARSERMLAQNPIDQQRLSSIIARFGWVAPTATTMLKDESPVMRAAAVQLLEQGAQATGPGRTAAIAREMRLRIYKHEGVAPYEEAYKTWRGQNGGNAVKDVLSTEHRQTFDRLVSDLRDLRYRGADAKTDPTVMKAADALDNVYNIMRKDMQHVGTIGAARLGFDENASKGYAPRYGNSSWFVNASQGQREAVAQEIANQLAGQWGDAKLASKVATQYLDHMRIRANGGTEVPLNIYSAEAGGILRDVLRANAVPAENIEQLLGRFSRGGAGFTKNRLDLDFSKVLTDRTTGQQFKMADALEHNQMKLLNVYSQRVAGEVALSQYGVMGEQGWKVLRRAAELSGAKAESLEAMDQVGAEFFGRTTGKGSPHLQTLRMATAASRLGGMAFNQFGETANAFAAVGVRAALDTIVSMPRLISEIRGGKANALLDDLEVFTGPIGKDHQVAFPYEEVGDARVYGADSINAFERAVRAGANAAHMLTGFQYVHGAQMRGMTEQVLRKALEYVQNGQEIDGALRDMGMSSDLYQALRAELPRIAEFDSRGRLTALQLTKAVNTMAAAEFAQLTQRAGRQIIQGTFIGETGKWAHSDFLKLLTQFRTFEIISMEKQFLRSRCTYGDAKALGLMIGSMSFALPIHLARVQLNAASRPDRQKYLDQQLNPIMLGRATLNYASNTGLIGDILDSGAAIMGYSPSGVKHAQGTGITEAIPAVGYLNSLGKAVLQRNPYDAVRALPGGSIPYLMPAFNLTKQPPAQPAH